MKKYVGIDISKDKLDVKITGSATYVISNTKDECHKLSQMFLKEDVERVVFESTGGYELVLMEELEKKRVSYTRENPRQIKSHGLALGNLCKTDRSDAEIIYDYAKRMKPEATRVKTQKEKRLCVFVHRLHQLTKSIAQERNRLSAPNLLKEIKNNILRVITALEAEKKLILEQTLNVIKEDKEYNDKFKLLKTYKGIGDICALVLIVRLPELGLLKRGQISALVGVAPYNNSSGNKDSRRSIFGGRADVRSLLYMAAFSAIRFNPVIKQFYAKLIQKNKSHRTARIACVRKILITLNAMVHANKAWDPKVCSLPENI